MDSLFTEKQKEELRAENRKNEINWIIDPKNKKEVQLKRRNASIKQAIGVVLLFIFFMYLVSHQVAVSLDYKLGEGMGFPIGFAGFLIFMWGFNESKRYNI